MQFVLTKPIKPGLKGNILGNVQKSKNEHGLTGLSRTGVIIMTETTL